MRINLVARLDKPVLRRLFKSFPEQVVVRSCEGSEKGAFGYQAGCISLSLYDLFIHTRVLAINSSLQKVG